MHNDPLQTAFKEYIQNTAQEAIVFEAKIPIAKFPIRLASLLGCHRKAFATTRAIKHLYDKRIAEEFDRILGSLPLIVGSPDYVYRNKNGKRGNFCFIKNIKGTDYFASFERISHEMQLVTAFRMRDDKYLKDYDLLRSWRDGAHSS